MTRFQWAIIGVLGTTVVVVFACLCYLMLSVLSTPSPTASPEAIVQSPETSGQVGRGGVKPTNLTPPTSTLRPIDTPRPTNTSQPTQTPIGIPPRGKYNHGYPVEEKYDKFTDTTEVSLSPIMSPATLQDKPDNLFSTYTYQGNSPKPPEMIHLGSLSIRSSWRYLQCHNLDFLLNGSKRLNPVTEHIGRVSGGGVVEMVRASLSLSDFLSIVNARSVDVKLCNDEFTLTYQQMEALRDLASRMNP